MVPKEDFRFLFTCGFWAQIHRNESVWADEHAAVTDGTPTNPSSSAPWTAKSGRGHEPGQCSFPPALGHRFASLVCGFHKINQ